MELLLTGALAHGCATGGGALHGGCDFGADCGDLNEHARRTRTLQQRREASSPARAGWDESWAADSDARTHYLEFIHERQLRLDGSAEAAAEKRRERAVLQEMQNWVQHQTEAALRQRLPIEVYVDFKQAREQQEREAAEHQAAVDARLEEFFDWAGKRWGEAARERVRALDSRHLLTEHPLRTQSLDALTAAVLDWAMTHSLDPDSLLQAPGWPYAPHQPPA